MFVLIKQHKCYSVELYAAEEDDVFLTDRLFQKTSTATRRWNKDVDRSLYSLRAYASKNPTLSPIKETFSFIGLSPAAQQTPSMSCAGKTRRNGFYITL